MSDKRDFYQFQTLVNLKSSDSENGPKTCADISTHSILCIMNSKRKQKVTIPRLLSGVYDYQIVETLSKKNKKIQSAKEKGRASNNKYRSNSDSDNIDKERNSKLTVITKRIQSYKTNMPYLAR